MAGTKEPMSPGEFAKYIEVLLEDVRKNAVVEYERALGLEASPGADQPFDQLHHTNLAFEHGRVDFGRSNSLAPRQHASDRIAERVRPSYGPDSQSQQHTMHTSQLRSGTKMMQKEDSERENTLWQWAHPPRLVASQAAHATRAVTSMGTSMSMRRLPAQSGAMRKKKLSLKEALRSDWNLHTSRWVLSPERSRLWDCVLVMAMLFVAVVSPVQVSMMDPKVDVMFFINCVIDVVFVVDMVMQFFMVYTVKTTFGNRLEHRHSRIVVHYLKTGFLIDFLSVLPFDLVALLMESKDFQAAKGLKVVRLLRLFKMARMLKASRMIRRLEANGFITYEGMALQKFIGLLLLVSHWLACLWALTLSLDDSVDIPRWTDGFDDLEENVELKTKDCLPKLYAASLYFTAYTITSVGYGDISPKNIIERVVCILMLFISGISWACVIGQVSSIVGNMDAQEQDFRRLMDNLNSMMKDRALPRSVCRRIRKFFYSAKQAQRNEQQEQILRRMSPDLQGEVVLMSNWYWVSQVSLIKHIMPKEKLDKMTDVSRAPHFVVDIALSLCSAVFAQSEVFGAPRVLYILKRGLAITRVRHWLKIVCAGAVWGEDFLLSDPRLRDPEARLALTYVEVFFLELRTFSQVVDRHRLASPELERQIRRFTVQLSARRAVLAEARWRRYKTQLELEEAAVVSTQGCPAEQSRWRTFKEQKKCLLNEDEGMPDTMQISRDFSSSDPEEMETIKRPVTPSNRPVTPSTMFDGDCRRCVTPNPNREQAPAFARLVTPPDTKLHWAQHTQPDKPIGSVACLP